MDRCPTTGPADGRRAPANQARLTERNLRIARAVDQVADELGATSAQVAVAWLRQRDWLTTLGRPMSGPVARKRR